LVTITGTFYSILIQSKDLYFYELIIKCYQRGGGGDNMSEADFIGRLEIEYINLDEAIKTINKIYNKIITQNEKVLDADFTYHGENKISHLTIHIRTKI
jgi:hypothetical protein